MCRSFICFFFFFFFQAEDGIRDLTVTGVQTCALPILLGEKFPGAQFMITGVLGPHSNAHGPNEFLHIPMGKKVTACVSKVISEHYAASLRGETSGSPVAADSGTRHGDHGCC